MSAYGQGIKGSIGYVEYAYAKENKMTHTQLQNREGAYFQPDDTVFQAAAANANWANAPGFYEVLTDQPGKTSCPITGASFIRLHKVQHKLQFAAAVLKFCKWSLKTG